MPKQTRVTSSDEKLDTIIAYLHRMDRRDRLRTWGGMIRTLIALIPIVFLLWSAWYAYVHGDELLKKIAQTAAEQSAAMMEKGGSGLGEELQKQLQQMMQR
jgi:uncharacterized membrane protein